MTTLEGKEKEREEHLLQKETMLRGRRKNDDSGV